jgi:hypothetical protein
MGRTCCGRMSSSVLSLYFSWEHAMHYNELRLEPDLHVRYYCISREEFVYVWSWPYTQLQLAHNSTSATYAKLRICVSWLTTLCVQVPCTLTFRPSVLIAVTWCPRANSPFIITWYTIWWLGDALGKMPKILAPSPLNSVHSINTKRRHSHLLPISFQTTRHTETQYMA